METISTVKSFGGTQGVYRHPSASTGTSMTFAVYVPPQVETGARLPVVTWLSGLTCSHANMMEKGGYQRACAELGLILVAPDTSPRGPQVADDGAFGLGQGAGFYLNATQEPWRRHYRMSDYVTKELPGVVAAHFASDLTRQGLFGHSMGGHGALTLALGNPGIWRSVSAFAPIVAPRRVPWGQKAFSAYLGPDEAVWRKDDAVALIEDGARLPELLIDQGGADPFLERELRPELLVQACAKAGIPIELRTQAGYDHSYYFIASFIEDHLRWHAQRLA